jgi:hypothetical protein
MEAGLFPGLAAQLCSWYRSDEMGKPIMWMFEFQNCAGVVGSLLAYGISYMNGACGMSAWRWYVLSRALSYTYHRLLLAGSVFLKASTPSCLESSSTWSYLTTPSRHVLLSGSQHESRNISKYASVRMLREQT